MATAEYKATLDPSGTARAASGNLASVLDAAMAVLVADGASPTQAHVTTANTALTNFKASDVSVYIGSTTNVSSLTKLKAALDAIYRTVQGSDLLVP